MAVCKNRFRKKRSLRSCLWLRLIQPLWRDLSKECGNSLTLGKQKVIHSNHSVSKRKCSHRNMKAIRLLPDRMPVHKKTAEVNIRSAIVKERNRIAYLIRLKIHATFSKFGKEVKTKCIIVFWKYNHKSGLTDYSVYHFYRPQTNLWEGNVFTLVSQSFCPQGACLHAPTYTRRNHLCPPPPPRSHL